MTWHSRGKKLDEEDLVGYILAGLDSDYDFVTSGVAACTESISVSELYGQLVYHEHQQELRGGRDYATVNAASRGRGGPPNRGSFGRATLVTENDLSASCVGERDLQSSSAT
jgi:hypothetical protein